MRYNSVIVDVTLRIEKDFDDLVSELKGLHFKLMKNGYLKYFNPFDSAGAERMTFQLKPLTPNSKIYMLEIRGEVEGLKSIIEIAFNRYQVDYRMIQVGIYSNDYSVTKYQNIIQQETRWVNETDNKIFLVNSTRKLSCLLMDDHVRFMTRDKLEFNTINQAIEECLQHVDVFIPNEEYNLFTFEGILAI